MANTNFDQTTLDLIEEVITYAISTPKEAVKGTINLDNGGVLVYKSWDELIEMRNKIKEIIDSETPVDLGEAKNTPFRPFAPTVCHGGNL